MTTLDATVPPRGRRLPPVPRAGSDVGSSDGTKHYWRLNLRGALLLMVTLGIYRFWLTTDIRRFLWSNTVLAGETLEYTGTARELLIGFLFAIAVLVPINAALFSASLNLGLLGQLSSVIAFVLLDRARPVRGLSRPALPADPHGLSRRAIPPGRLGLALCGLRAVLVGDDCADARPRLSVRAVAARALQDAQHFLRRSARALRWDRAGGCSFVAS